MKPKFKIISRDKGARAGEIETPHGTILTPTIFPVGTKGTVKSLTGEQIKEIGPQGVLANTYHLHLQPGEDVVAKLGGLSKMMDWNGPTMTDSGGFQVFSLGIGLEKPGVKFLKDQTEDIEGRKPRLNKITEEGVTFQSHIDGSKQFISPESSIAIQEKLGADLIVSFDDLESPTYNLEEAKKSFELTKKWEIRSLKAQKRKDQLMYGVTHGGRFKELRVESAKFVDEHFDAIALGGAHASKENLYEVIDWTTANVSENKPRHLLGIGEVDDIFEGVERGIDTFDCVIPTRLGRMGHVFISPPTGNAKNRFRYDITKSKFEKDSKPIDPSCKCYVCQNYTRAYINHLFRSKELLAYNLATYHNVYFLLNLTRQIRESIISGRFDSLKMNWL
jgi:queuine tRNA-ribosyltransferase/7-cyano-7-deazaguanine tRNA-ribosyltransferase